MAEALNFPSTTPNTGAPLLFSGQAQREFILNQTLSTIDALLMGTVEASLAAAPENATDGQCFRISANSTGEWQNKEGQLAVRIGGGWHYVEPTEGLEVYDKAAGQKLLYKSGWLAAAAPTLPAGGGVIDTEMRTVFGELIQALRNIGVFTDS
ncbi:MAG: DUF2793 domain-containing protein [Pseudomonadota bacterium]